MFINNLINICCIIFHPMATAWQDHPLLQRAGVSDAQVELHPETSFAEDFQKAFSVKRIHKIII